MLGTALVTLSLARFDVAPPERQPAMTEKIIRKLAARIDAVASAGPSRRTFQRLPPFTETLALLAEPGALPHHDWCVSC